MTDDFDFHGLDALEPADLQQEEAVITYAADLATLFTQSPEAGELELDGEDAGFWPYELVTLGFEASGMRIHRADVDAVREVVLEIWPRLIPTADHVHPRHAIPALTGFWRFLGRAFGQPHAAAVLAMLPALEAEFLTRMQDPRESSRLGPRPPGVPAVADLSTPLDLAAIAALNPASEAGQRDLHAHCVGAARRFLCTPEGERARQHGELAEIWIAAFLKEGIMGGMAAWPGELGVEDAEEILLHGLPDKPLIQGSDADEVVAVLQDFWRYLGRVHKFPNAGLIVAALNAHRDRFRELLAARSPDEAAMNRVIGHMAEAAGMDMDDPEIRAAVTEDVKSGVLGEILGEDMDDPDDAFGAGPPMPATPGGAGDPDRKKKRKAARAARKSNKQRRKKKK